MQSRLVPKFFSMLSEGIPPRQILRDMAAGATVGIVALPLALAFAIASGVQPTQGLATAVVAGFIISVLGGSRVQIGGPTGAFIILVYGVVATHGYAGLAVATIMAGVLLVLMGIARLGSVIKFVPYPVTVGFTAGIAVIVGVSQLRDLLGLRIAGLPPGFPETIQALSRSLDTMNFHSLAVGLLALGILVGWPRLTRRLPASLVCILATSLLVHWLHWPVETVGDRFGAIPSGLPAPHIPEVSWGMLRELSSPALSIAILAAIESLLSAVVADGMIGSHHRSNMELVAQGVANIASPLFGGIPATGAIARTATNVKCGGRTPVAGVTHALTLFLIVTFFGRWAAAIPLAALAGILLHVAYNMSEWRRFLRLFRSPRSDVLVLLATFGLTVLIDLAVAIQVGMVLAAFLFMKRMAGLSQAGYITEMLREEELPGDAGPVLSIPEGVEIFEIQGTFFFGAASTFRNALRRVEKSPKVLILRLREVLAIDATGLEALEELEEGNRRNGTVLVLSGLRPDPRETLRRSGFLALIGPQNVTGDIEAALGRAREILGSLDPVGSPGG